MPKLRPDKLRVPLLLLTQVKGDNSSAQLLPERMYAWMATKAKNGKPQVPQDQTASWSWPAEQWWGLIKMSTS